MLNTAPNLKFWYNAVLCRTGMGIFENTGRRKNGKDRMQLYSHQRLRK